MIWLALVALILLTVIYVDRRDQQHRREDDR
jgi:hypothetical protein